MKFFRPFFNNMGIFSVPHAYYGNSFLYNARLLCCNFFNGISQYIRMIQCNWCDDSHNRVLYWVGRIESSAKPRLQNNVFHIGLGKSIHSHAKKEFKIRRVGNPVLFHLFYCIHHKMKCLQKFFVRDFLSLYNDSFIDFFQMRRNEHSGFLTVSQQHCL